VQESLWLDHIGEHFAHQVLTTTSSSSLSLSISSSSSVLSHKMGSSSGLNDHVSRAVSAAAASAAASAAAIDGTFSENATAATTAAELHAAWPVMLKYFDGVHALEEIAAREGLKRRTVSSLVSKLVDAGWLVVVQHW